MGYGKCQWWKKINEIIANWNRCAFRYENYYKSSEFYLVSDCKWFFCFSAVVVFIPYAEKKRFLRKNFHSFLWLTGSLVAFCSTPNRRHPLGDFFSCIWRDLDKLCVLLRPLGVFFSESPDVFRHNAKFRFYELIEKSITKQFSLQAQALSFLFILLSDVS